MSDDKLRPLLLGLFAIGLAVSITLAELALVALALRLGFRMVTGRVRLETWPLVWPFAAWIAASILSALASGHVLESLAAAKGLLLIVTFYAVLDALPDVTSAERFVAMLLALIGAVGVIGILQVAFCPNLNAWAPSLGRVASHCHRAHAFYSIYMTMAGVLSLVLLAALPSVLAMPARSRERRTAAIAWLIGGAALALTYVRGAWVGFVVGIAVLVTLLRRGRALVVAAVLLLGLGIALAPGLRHRAESIADPSDPTARDRWAMWRSGIAMAEDRPVVGFGPGGVKREYPTYVQPDALRRTRGHLHNSPLQILVERGVIGLVTWLSIFLTFFGRAIVVLRALEPEERRERALATGSIAAIAGFLIGGLTEYNFGDSEVVMVAYVVMTLPFVVERARSRPRVQYDSCTPA